MNVPTPIRLRTVFTDSAEGSDLLLLQIPPDRPAPFGFEPGEVVVIEPDCPPTVGDLVCWQREGRHFLNRYAGSISRAKLTGVVVGRARRVPHSTGLPSNN